MKNFSVGIVFNIIWVLLACKAEKPGIDYGEIEIFLRERTKQWIAVESQKSLEATLEFIDSSGYYLANDWPTLQGHKEISSFLNAAFDMPMGEIEGTTEEIQVAQSGDMAYEIGHTKVPYSFEDLDTVYNTQYLVVWKKTDDVWKAVATSINSHP